MQIYLPGNKKPLIISKWPQRAQYIGLVKERSRNDFEIIRNIISVIRNARAENKVEPSRKIKAIIYTKNKKELIEQHSILIQKMRTGVENLQVKSQGEKISEAIYIVLGDIEIYLLGALDKEKEKQRLEKEVQSLKHRISNLQTKLNNSNFLEKAPASIVLSQKEKLNNYQQELEKLNKKLGK